MAGLSEVSRDKYGVFPLRGKLLNVREANHKQLMENAEIQHLKQILGLQQGKEYTNVKSLRYGHMMIMTDQDHDGSHIKGLLINFIHAFWPSLLKVQSFMVEFITPIVKATNNKTKDVFSFYSMPEYESWKQSLGGNASGWSIKYYKGLGTSTSKEGKEYFKNLDMHRKEFVWQTEEDGEAIELAFSKKKIEARKNWLRQFEPGTHLDQKERLIKYSDFINKELILFSMADLQRSIPSMVDGLKPGQRKILFCAFKRNFVKEAKVAQFSGYVSEHSAYHHGEASLASTIIGMAQDYVGSNNINLLQPNGQFGTRNQGGKDAASARYIFTRLSPITRYLFPKDDDGLLNYLNEDGQSIEPTWYMPVIPTVLVNGSEGIGTGWSTYVPNYNPRDIIMNVRHLLTGEEMEPMHPWYRGFKGTIEKTASKEAGVTYTITGIVEEINETTLRVTELPIRRWTNEYKEFLEAMSSKEQMDPLIKDFKAHSDDANVDFDLFLTEEKMHMVKQEGILKKLKLTTTISTSNMHLFDANGVIKKYNTPEQILEDFFSLRLEFYEKRKRVLLDNLEKELVKLDNKVRFILAVVHGEIIVNNRKRAELFIELHEKGFTPIPKKKSVDVVVAGATDENDDTEENSEVGGSRGVRGSDYDYLLSMAIGTLTLEKVQELCADRDKLNQDVEDLRNKTPKSLWLGDLDKLEEELDVEDKKEAEAEEQQKLKSKKKRDEGSKAPKQAAKAPRKNTKKVNDKKAAADEPSGSGPMESENALAEVAKPKVGRGGQKKAPAKKVNDSEDDDEEFGLPSLRERLAKYNLNSSPEQSTAMETEEPQVPAGKKEAATKKAAVGGRKKSTMTVISDDVDEIEVVETTDDDFDAAESAGPGKKKGAAKGKAAAAKPPAPARKRGPTKKQAVAAASQKLLTEMLKPAGESPEKKVRKMRVSPFNKKSGSMLGRASAENSGWSSSSSVLQDIEEVAEVPAPAAAKPRPQRANRKQMTYVVSDSSEEEEENDVDDDATEDSDFDEADD